MCPGGTVTVSIHAPTRGATLVCFSGGQDSTTFQSTHPHGVRHKTLWVSCFLNYVSIHAPTRGATSQFLRYFALSSCFNPRTHTGCDVFSDEYLLAFIKFQSTHPHGVRPDFVEVHVLWKSFNPRTHTGCDVTNPTSSPFKSEFQSTHPHGVRLRK